MSSRVPSSTPAAAKTTEHLIRKADPGVNGGADRRVGEARGAFTRAELATLAGREQYREWYLRNRDPIAEDRLRWRAQTFRHLVHLLPGQTVLELGCGRGSFTRSLANVSRGENPITAVTFLPEAQELQDLPSSVTIRAAGHLPIQTDSERFDFVIGLDMLDRENCTAVLRCVYELLKPGGQVVFYETNPWNLLLRVRRWMGRLSGRGDPRSLLDRVQLYELLSEVGFIRVFSVFNDFVYRPLTARNSWALRNLSIVLENTAGVRTFAGSILLHAQKPPRSPHRPRHSLCDHPTLAGRVSVVVPCHNEEMNVGPLVTRLRELYGTYLHEIVLVDDNSTDGTWPTIQRLAEQDDRIRGVHRQPPNGVGLALRDGLRAATGEYVLTMDCDFQHLLPEVRDLFDAAADGFDVVIGSRFSRHSVLLNYPVQKIIANRGFHLIARLVLGRSFRDLTNNLKLFRREVVERLELREPGFAVNAETGLQPLLLGYRIKEVPISWINRSHDMGVSSFRLARVGGGYWSALLRARRSLGRVTKGRTDPPVDSGRRTSSASSPEE